MAVPRNPALAFKASRELKNESVFWWIATGRWLGRKQFFAERFARDFIGPVGIGIEAHERSIDIGQVLFDGIEVERALMCVHALIVDRQIA